MCDGIVLAKVTRLGYTFNHDDDTKTWWYRLDSTFVGPYRNMDEAAYAALTDHEIEEITNAQ